MASTLHSGSSQFPGFGAQWVEHTNLICVSTVTTGEGHMESLQSDGSVSLKPSSRFLIFFSYKLPILDIFFGGVRGGRRGLSSHTAILA